MFNMYLVCNKKILESDEIVSKLQTQYADILINKEYDEELDDATSILFDICDIFHQSELVKFEVTGFGEEHWPATCLYDLTDVIEDIYYTIWGKIQSGDYNFKINFEEQSLQRNVVVQDEGKLKLTCKSRLEWFGTRDEVILEKSDLKKMICNLYLDFMCYAERLCPTLVKHPMMTDWVQLVQIMKKDMLTQ